MIGNCRAAVGLHERVGFRTGEVALLPTDPAQQEAKRATVTRVGVIAFERPGGVRDLCEEQTRAMVRAPPTTNTSAISHADRLAVTSRV
jgi:hypothetical protein